MSEILKRIIFGAIYVAVMWFGTSYSKLTFNILFLSLGLWSLYEMWKLREGKSKLIALLYVITPFFLIQLFGMADTDYPKNTFNPSIILLMFILTWTFDTFAFIVGVKFGKNRILPSVSPKKSWEGFIGGLFFCVLADLFHSIILKIILKIYPIYIYTKFHFTFYSNNRGFHRILLQKTSGS